MPAWVFFATCMIFLFTGLYVGMLLGRDIGRNERCRDHCAR